VARSPERDLQEIIIVGAGGIVRDAHLPAYRKAGFRVAGIYDIDPAKAATLAAEYGIPVIYDSMSDVKGASKNAVFDLATPPDTFTQLISCLAEGAAVLLQKPMGRTLEEARAILMACRAKKLTAAVNFQLRFAPAIVKARQMIEQGEIGELHDIEVRVTAYTPWHLWTFLESAPRLEILYHSIHYVDLIRSFLGNPTRVYARTVKHPATSNLASTRTNIIMDYGDLIRANITTNHGHAYGEKHQESYVKWEGTRGAIRVGLGVLLDYPKGRRDTLEFAILDSGKEPKWQADTVEGNWFPDAFIGSMATLLDFIAGKTKALPTGVDDAIETMAVVESAYESNDRGGVRVAYV
jgi:predicted dehydrogenase